MTALLFCCDVRHVACVVCDVVAYVYHVFGVISDYVVCCVGCTNVTFINRVRIMVMPLLIAHRILAISFRNTI